jgi:hypothetical protein
MKDLAKEWKEFKKFRIKKREENLKSAEYLLAQEELRKAFASQPKSVDISPYSFIVWEMAEMIWKIALMSRDMAESRGIPPENVEGLLDWLSNDKK